MPALQGALGLRRGWELCASATRLPDHFVERLGAAGVLSGTIDPRTIRLVTHAGIDDEAITATITALDGLGAA